MRAESSARLDAIDAYKPGAGNLDAFIFATQSGFGAGVDYGHRISSDWSAFANAQASYIDELSFAARAGVRGRF